MQTQRTASGTAIGAHWQAEGAEDLVISRRQAALVVAVKVDFHFGTVGETVTVVFIEFIKDTGVPAKAPLVTLQIRDLGVCRDPCNLLCQRRRQCAGARNDFAEIARVTFDFRFSINGIKANAEAPVTVQTVSTAQVQVQSLKVGFTALGSCCVVVIKLGR